MAPKAKSQTLFPAGESEYRSARLRCAVACQNYNRQPENATPEQRTALWLDIVQPNNSGNLTTELGANQSLRHKNLASSAQSLSVTDDSAATRSAVSPLLLNFDNVPGRGTLPGAHLQLTPDSISKSHQPASKAVASSQGFPGQGIAPYLKPPIHIDYGTRLEIAPSTFINRNCKILDTPVRNVRIGERCLIGPDFHIYAVSHPLDYRERKGPADAPSYALDVIVEDECWIGGGVTILGGVTIGRGCVIGAKSLVTRDIPAYHLAYGSPARVIRRIAALPAEENWNLPAIADKVAGVANRPLRVRDFFFIVCGMVGVWSLVRWLLSSRSATS